MVMTTLVIKGSDEERLFEIDDSYIGLLPGATLVIAETQDDGSIEEAEIKIESIEIPCTIDNPGKVNTTSAPIVTIAGGAPLKKLAVVKKIKNQEKPEKPTVDPKR